MAGLPSTAAGARARRPAGERQTRTHFPSRFRPWAQMLLQDYMGTRGPNATMEKLNVIKVVRATARFRAFPDDAGIALKGDKPVARVGPILELLDGQVIAGLAASTSGE